MSLKFLGGFRFQIIALLLCLKAEWLTFVPLVSVSNRTPTSNCINVEGKVLVSIEAGREEFMFNGEIMMKQNPSCTKPDSGLHTSSISNLINLSVFKLLF